jgi:hypothetical protein
MAECSETIPSRPGHYVYRLWADDVCLYVGRCGEVKPRRVHARLRAHKARKAWWPQVNRIDVATFSSAAEIILEEPKQIAELNPVHNKVLKAWCANGHDTSDPDSRDEDRRCRQCLTDNQRAYAKTPKGRAGKAATQRRYRDKTGVRERRNAQDRLRRSGRRPASTQQALW